MASLFLESGEWQAEDVGEVALQHAADRVIAAARAAAALWNGREPALTPGVYCGWCPRAEVCPAAQISPGYVAQSFPDRAVPKPLSVSNTFGMHVTRNGRHPMGSVSRGFRLAKASWGSCKEDRELLWLPVISFLCSLVVMAVFGLGMWAIGLPDAGRVAEPRASTSWAS